MSRERIETIYTALVLAGLFALVTSCVVTP